MSQSVATPSPLPSLSAIDPALDRPTEASGNAAAANADDMIAALAGEQIDRLLAEAEGPPTPAPRPVAAPSPVTSSVAPVVTAAPAATVQSPAAVHPAVVTTADFDAVLSAAAIPATPAVVVAPPPPPPPAPPPQVPGVPLLLKPLVLLNAPLAACPDRVREVAGKVAIVTFVNAVGVLAYTFAFHRPH